jgi:hypothetical protein
MCIYFRVRGYETLYVESPITQMVPAGTIPGVLNPIFDVKTAARKSEGLGRRRAQTSLHGRGILSKDQSKLVGQ